MAEAITNTSPLLYLYRIGVINHLPILFKAIWVPEAVVAELVEGRRRGYDVPQVEDYSWLEVVNPVHLPSEWLALDLGKGELAAMALALEHSERVILLDDALARRVAQAAGLEVWGTLRVLLEGKKAGLIDKIEPLLNEAERVGLWISPQIKQRILALADESKSS